MTSKSELKHLCAQNPVATLKLTPRYDIAFHNSEKQIGVLDFNGPVMTFEGEAEESAKMFFDFIAKSFAGRLEEERKYGATERIVELERQVEEQKRTIETLNTCIGGKDSLTTDNITRIEELEQRAKVLTDVMRRGREELRACQAAIHLSGDFDPRYVSDAQAMMKQMDAALNATPQQTAEQIERWHVEWMMKLPVAGVIEQSNFGNPQQVHLVAIPQLPETKESTK